MSPRGMLRSRLRFRRGRLRLRRPGTRRTRGLVALAVGCVVVYLVSSLAIRRPCTDDDGKDAEVWSCTLYLDLPSGSRCRTPSRTVCARSVEWAALVTTRDLEWSFPAGSRPADARCDQDLWHPHITPPCLLADGGLPR